MGVLYELATGLFGSAENPYPAFEIANRGLLESAIGLPHQPYYVSFYDKLAAMVRSIAANHALRDGNKRLAVTVLHSTLLANGFIYLWADDDAVEIALRCVRGDTDYVWLSEFIEAWSVHGGWRLPLDVDLTRVAIEATRAGVRNALDFYPAVGDVARSLMSAHARGELDAAVISARLARVRSSEAT